MNTPRTYPLMMPNVPPGAIIAVGVVILPVPEEIAGTLRPSFPFRPLRLDVQDALPHFLIGPMFVAAQRFDLDEPFGDAIAQVGEAIVLYVRNGTNEPQDFSAQLIGEAIRDGAAS